MEKIAKKIETQFFAFIKEGKYKDVHEVSLQQPNPHPGAESDFFPAVVSAEVIDVVPTLVAIPASAGIFFFRREHPRPVGLEIQIHISPWRRNKNGLRTSLWLRSLHSASSKGVISMAKDIGRMTPPQPYWGMFRR